MRLGPAKPVRKTYHIQKSNRNMKCRRTDIESQSCLNRCYVPGCLLKKIIHKIQVLDNGNAPFYTFNSFLPHCTTLIFDLASRQDHSFTAIQYWKRTPLFDACRPPFPHCDHTPPLPYPLHPSKSSLSRQRSYPTRSNKQQKKDEPLYFSIAQRRLTKTSSSKKICLVGWK